ncbi:MAG: helix-turn-helix transcriptional regulator [Oscillospiraceae bacterium]
MSFGQNLQYLRRLHNKMTQEELAEAMNVSRQTVSKWELDGAYPELDKLIELCRIFSCTLDQLVRSDLNVCSEAYSDLCVTDVDGFSYVRYAVISPEPEEDAIAHVRRWAEKYGDASPDIIGWDFPMVSQEQINVFHMHGYAAAWVLPDKVTNVPEAEIITQKAHKYAKITITDPFSAAFDLIPNGYKTLMSYMQVNGIKHVEDKNILSCFEREYFKDGVSYMDVYIAAE